MKRLKIKEQVVINCPVCKELIEVNDIAVYNKKIEKCHTGCVKKHNILHFSFKEYC